MQLLKMAYCALRTFITLLCSGSSSPKEESAPQKPSCSGGSGARLDQVGAPGASSGSHGPDRAVFDKQLGLAPTLTNHKIDPNTPGDPGGDPLVRVQGGEPGKSSARMGSVEGDYAFS